MDNKMYYIHITGNSNISIFIYLINNYINTNIYNNNTFEHIKTFIIKYENHDHLKIKKDFIIAFIKDLVLEFIKHENEEDKYIYFIKILSNYMDYKKDYNINLEINNEKNIYILKIEDIFEKCFKCIIKKINNHEKKTYFFKNFNFKIKSINSIIPENY